VPTCPSARRGPATFVGANFPSLQIGKNLRETWLRCGLVRCPDLPPGHVVSCIIWGGWSGIARFGKPPNQASFLDRESSVHMTSPHETATLSSQTANGHRARVSFQHWLGRNDSCSCNGSETPSSAAASSQFADPSS